MGNLFLIDYENVGSDGLNGIEKLSEKDEVMVFYSFKSNNLTWDAYKKIQLTKATFNINRVNVGSENALDFQLSSYLGYLIGQDMNRRIYVISADKGYDYVLNFWKNRLECKNLFRGISINSFIEEDLLDNRAAIKKIFTSVDENISEKELDILEDLLKNNKKDKIHNFMQSKSGFKKANYMYNKFKKIFF